MKYPEEFAVIVVGAGHAGVEAALASARSGCKTLLVTHNLETIGQLSCNPAIGGIGKGHIVREIDAMGGLMARASDAAGIHVRILNSSKGAAVRATRAQADRVLYKTAVRRALDHAPNLNLFQQAVDDLLIDNGDGDGRVCGVRTELGIEFRARAVVLTAGTFLNGRIHVGDDNTRAGRAGEVPSLTLAQRLREMPFAVGRLKTGTPPRIDGKSIDYSRLQSQPGENPPPRFSFINDESPRPRQVCCHITATNPATHEIIARALHRSPVYGGAIEGAGPRYCPSIEDKVVRFAERDRHQIFIEPEGLDTAEIYPNGISTSLPFDVQHEFVRTIAGFARAVITRPGYAVEYDFFDPRGLKQSLETKCIGGLFFAGQINGTTGYEEAAGQGLIAGLNASRLARGLESWHPARDQAYIGVMIDDLTTLGASEPYRMFTSRAEYRLQLREDNADLRLTEIAHELGLVDAARLRMFMNKRDAIARERKRLRETRICAATLDENLAVRALGQTLQRDTNLLELLRRPEVSYENVMQLAGRGEEKFPADEIIRQLEIEARYDGYINRQREEIARVGEKLNMPLPAATDYCAVRGLSSEAAQKLSEVKPQTLGQAARIPGVTPAAISLLMVHLKKRRAA